MLVRLTQDQDDPKDLVQRLFNLVCLAYDDYDVDISESDELE